MDPVFAWIVGSGLLMSAIALVGSLTLLLSERALQRISAPAGGICRGVTAAADLIPEVKAHEGAPANVVHFASFEMGVALRLAVKLGLKP